MTISQVQEILKSNFADASERQYWIDKLTELERKEANIKENNEYYNKMFIYDR